MDDHQQMKCLFQIVFCKYQQVGCNKQVSFEIFYRINDNKGFFEYVHLICLYFVFFPN